MILLRNILQELEYGKKLFAHDPEDQIADYPFEWDKFIEKLYSPDFEANTWAEDAILKALQAYTSGKQGRTDTLANMLRKLLPLKSKFPRILDPMGNTTKPPSWKMNLDWAADYPDHAWRGTRVTPAWAHGKLADPSAYRTIAISQAWTTLDGPDDNLKAYIIDDGSVTYRSKGEAMISFSESPRTALNFAKKASGNTLPVILGVSKRHPELIMNIDSMEALSEYNEAEMFLLNSTFNPDVIVFLDPWSPEYISTLV